MKYEIETIGTQHCTVWSYGENNVNTLHGIFNGSNAKHYAELFVSALEHEQAAINAVNKFEVLP